MRRIEYLNGLILGVALLGGTYLGCAEEGASTPPPATPTAVATASSAPPPAEDNEASESLSEHHRHHHHGGVVMFIAMSLDSLGVSPQQAAAIEKIQGDLFAKMEPAHLAEENVLAVLADGIAAGKVDEVKVDAAIDQVKTASAGLHDAAVDALNRLHEALTPEQRAALIDKVEAHWRAWQSANPPEAKPGGHLDTLAKNLALTPDQVEKIRATFADRVKNHPQKLDSAQVEAHLQEFATAFKAATFDAKTLTKAGPVHQNLAVWGARRMAHFYGSIDPLLNADQRAKLSAELKAHATAKSGILDENKQER